MDKRFLTIIALLLTVSLTGLMPQGAVAAPAQTVVMIDPAHGGDEPGVGADKVREKDLTLQLALLVRQEAQKSGSFQVQLLRQTDKTMGTAERIKAVQEARTECLISLHVNAGFGKKAEGYEVYFPGFRQGATVSGETNPIVKDMASNRHLNDSVRLAQQIQAALETVFPRKGRGLRDAPSPLLEGISIPGLVVEIGFATRPEERDKLTEAAVQKALARAIVKGVQGYLQKTP